MTNVNIIHITTYTHCLSPIPIYKKHLLNLLILIFFITNMLDCPISTSILFKIHPIHRELERKTTCGPLEFYPLYANFAKNEFPNIAITSPSKITKLLDYIVVLFIIYLIHQETQVTNREED